MGFKIRTGKKSVAGISLSSFLICLLVILVTISEVIAAGYTIEGDTVKWENDFGILSVHPHTCNDFNCVQYANATSKIDQDIDLNFSFIFPEAIKGDVWLWENYSHMVQVPYQDTCSESEECLTQFDGMCEIEDFNPEMTYNQTCDYIENNICYWSYNCIKYQEEEKWFYDWKDKTHLINHLEYQNEHYYYILNVPFKALESKQIKWEYKVPIRRTDKGFGSFGKWKLYLWRGDYKNPSQSVVLDPWWDSNWGYRKYHNITGSTAGAVVNYSVEIKVYNTTGTDNGNIVYIGDKAKEDFSDVRFTNDTNYELFYWIEETGSDYAVFWVKVPDIPASPNNETIWIYYDNSEATSKSNINDTFIFGDDFESDTVGEDPTKWNVTETGANVIDVSSTQACNSSQSVYLYDNTGTGYPIYINRTFEPQEKLLLTYYFYHVNFGDQGTSTAFYLYSGETQAIWMAVTGNYLKYYDTKYNNITDVETGKWYKIEVLPKADTDKFDCWVNGTKFVTNGNFRNTVTEIDWIVSSAWSTPTWDAYYDTVTIRKYIDPEPFHADWGGEEEVIPPTYSDNSTNNTVAGSAVEFRLRWTDNVNLSSYIFSLDNCTGSFSNVTESSFPGAPINESWSNETYVINDTVGCTIRWKVYANDASDNWNVSDEYSFVTTYNPYISSCSVLDQAGETYYLTEDISNSGTSNCINISANNVVFDCQGHLIDGNDVADYGIYVDRSSGQTTNITVKNCVLNDWDSANIYLYYANGNNLTNITSTSSPDHGFYLYYSDSNTITNTTANSNNYGFYLNYADSNTFTNTTANSNDQYGFRLYISADSNTFTNTTANSNNYGFYLYSSDSNTISNSTAKENSLLDFDIDETSDIHCNNNVESLTGSNDLPIKYFKSSVNLANEELSELVLCDADNSNIDNITINASQTKDNNVILIHRTSNSNFTNIVSSENYYGFYLYVANSNTFSNITANSNYRGFLVHSSDSNTISNITANSNDQEGFYLFSSDSNTIYNCTANSNSQYGFTIRSSDSNTISNSTIENNTNYGIYLWDAGQAGANEIYNNLFNNTNNFGFYGTIYANNWNTTRQTGDRIYSNGTEIGGNYWTNSTGNDYSDTCTDANKDGFCDSPYIIDPGQTGNNTDYFPLSDEYSAAQTESITQAIPVTESLTKSGNYFRKPTQPFSLTSSIVKIFGAIKTISETISSNIVIAKLTEITRAISQSFNISGFVTATTFTIYERIVSVYLTITGFVQRSFINVRVISQVMTLDVIVSRLRSVYRSVFGSISFILRSWFPCWIFFTQSSCESAGCHWCNNACQLQSCGVPPSEVPGGSVLPSVVVEKINFAIDKDYIKVLLKPGGTVRELVDISNTGDIDLTITVNMKNLEEFLVFPEGVSEYTFDLSVGEMKSIQFIFSASGEQELGVFPGEIIVTGDEIEKIISVVVEVESIEPLFDIDVEIPQKYKEVLPGEEVLVQLMIFNVKRIERVDVEVEYGITDTLGNVIASEHETLAVEMQVSVVRSLDIPFDLEPGNYILYATVKYDDTVGTGADIFRVVTEKRIEIPTGIILLIIFLILAVIGFIVWFKFLKKPKEDKFQKLKEYGLRFK